VGAGDRGRTYAEQVRAHPQLGRVVAVAEPDPERRLLFAARHGLDPKAVYTDWQSALSARPRAKAVFVCTQDADHAAPAIAFARAGYHVLLEKPMATTPEDCRAVVEAVENAGILFAVCHVLRYTPITLELRRLIASGAIGDVVGAHRLEPVGYWHFAHAYVRGHWRREEFSGSVLLAKCCHDLDWLRSLLGSRCLRVCSFGGLHHFRPERRPLGASDRCLTCQLEPDCPYSAPRLYLGELERGNRGWPVDVVALNPSPQTIAEALDRGPYGRCVYACDNDVPDHQVVSLEFAGARWATFTMSAFTPQTHRKTTVFGTHGCIIDDGQQLEVTDFRTAQTRPVVVPGAEERHGGGDEALIRSFLSAVLQDDRTLLSSGPREALESYLMVFAAERARRERRVVELEPPHGKMER
jgi:predicted dehydrogenase